ncbi:10737_t:CDS:2, partial [Funneliformis caledonium]
EWIFLFSDRRSRSFVLLRIGEAERSFFLQIGDKSSLGDRIFLSFSDRRSGSFVLLQIG